mmetsp:Transcript_18324/g.23597  ORF Transcript_18324/g.23597 Transcript_18324/m.23597 type:complete len:128 (+) Transcript_18324:120-503(+)
MPIHFQTPTIIHSLLLFLQLPHLLSDSVTLGNGAFVVLTLLSMDTQKGPDSFAYSATSLNFDSTDARMFEVVLHLRTIGGRTTVTLASRRVLDQLDVQQKIALTLLAILLGKAASLFRCIRINGNCL